LKVANASTCVKRLFLTTMALLLLGAATVWADSMKDGDAAYQRGDYASASKIYRSLAVQGNARAQNRLGMIFLQGLGVAHDDAEASKWFRLAATQGLAEAQLNLGAMYAEGLGLVQNYAEAGKWFRRAAEQGNAKAQFSLGLLYMSGRGVAHDDAQALKWYRRAAAQGLTQAQYTLGSMYERGQSIKQDYGRAYMWFDLGAKSGDADCARSRDHIATLMTPKQIAQARKMVRDHQRRASNGKGPATSAD
jgi:uncharacterized protein